VPNHSVGKINSSVCVFSDQKNIRDAQHKDSDIDLAIIFKSVDDIIELQIDLMKMRKDEDLLIEPHPFSEKDFVISNPVVSEILKTGIPIPYLQHKAKWLIPCSALILLPLHLQPINVIVFNDPSWKSHREVS
jgi:predicted nucleotidyltransferase